MTSGEFQHSPESASPVAGDILLDAVSRKFDVHPDKIGGYLCATGQVFETLDLVGDVHLRREVLDDGTRGTPDIDYRVSNLSGSIGWNERVELNEDGQWVHVFGDDHRGGTRQTGDKLSPFRKGIILARVFASPTRRSNLWEDDDNEGFEID